MVTARYHILPEEGRPSAESTREDERLLSPVNFSSPSTKSITITYHPTVVLRLIVLALLISSFVVYILGQSSLGPPPIVFLSFAITRNVLVLLLHFGESIGIRIVFVGRQMTAGGARQRKHWETLSALSWRSVSLGIDLTLIAVLLITSVVAYTNTFWWQRNQVVDGCIICWVAIPLYLVASIDTGKPSRITTTSIIAFKLGEGTKDSLPTTSTLQGVHTDAEHPATAADDVETLVPS